MGYVGDMYHVMYHPFSAEFVRHSFSSGSYLNSRSSVSESASRSWEHVEARFTIVAVKFGCFCSGFGIL